ncbi:MAG: hypothetical protein JW822_03070 [Spirochaetales bacterium]|nr:hypothetical protein [Spirochaetales bacterium]
MAILKTPGICKKISLIFVLCVCLMFCSVYILAQEPRFRLIKQETTDSKGIRTWYVWEYDEHNHCIKEQWDTTADSYGYTITYTYDTGGKKIKYFKQMENGATAYEIYTYNSDGLISNKEVKSELEHHTLTAYAYDKRGNMLSAHEVNIEDKSPVQTVLYTYDAKNQLTRQEIKYFNGGRNSATTYSYDKLGNLVEDSLSWEGTDRVYQNNYYYDEQGRKVKQTQGYTGSAKKTTMTWTYDEKNRLIKYDHTGSFYTFKTYEYDNKGNVIKEFQDNGGYTFTYTHTFDTYGNKTETVFNDSKGESSTTVYTYETY